MNTGLSIYIPFFKGLRYLREAVESVRAQSNPNWTLVVMDDCGPDGTEACVWLKALNDPRISYIRHSENKGMVANWNACLDHAAFDFAKKNSSQTQSQLVTLLHDDDRLLPNYVDLMLQEYTATPEAALYFCGAEIIDGAGKKVFSVPDAIKKLIAPAKPSFTLQGPAAFEALLAGCFIMCPTVCYNLAVIGERRFTLGLKQVQDLDFYLRLLADGLTLKGSSQKAYAYRRHSSNATAIQTQSLLRFREEVELYNTWAQRLTTLGFNRAATVAASKRIIVLNLLYCILRDLVSFSFAHAQTKTRFLLQNVLNSQTQPQLEGSQT